MRNDCVTRKAASASMACLPAALASVLLGLLPAPVAAAAAPNVRSQIESASQSPLVMLELVDGQMISGKFNGFIGTWSDTVDSATRYEAWRRAHPVGVPRLGDPLFVVLVSGDTLRGSFKGVGPTFLALGGGNSRFEVPVSLDAIADVKTDRGDSLASWADLRERLLDAPALIGVGLVTGTKSVIVARESIFSARGNTSQHGSSSPTILLAGLALVVAGILICASTANDAQNSLNSCSSPSSRVRTLDDRFGSSDVSHGLRAWVDGETGRP